MAATLAAAVALAGPAWAEGELNIYNWGNYTNPELIEKFEAEFDIDVSLDGYDSNEIMLAKVREGNTGYDIVVPSDSTAAIMVEQGLLAAYDRATGLSVAQERAFGRDELQGAGVEVAATPGSGTRPAEPSVVSRASLLRTYETRPGGLDRVMTPQVIATLVAAVLLAEVALIAGAAYATGARRRLRELGLLGANGATTAHVRGAVVGEATVTGIVGAVAGIGAGLAVLRFGRPLMQRFLAPLLTRLELSTTDLLGPAVVVNG
jgi:hypothetical protein